MDGGDKVKPEDCDVPGLSARVAIKKLLPAVNQDAFLKAAEVKWGRQTATCASFCPKQVTRRWFPFPGNRPDLSVTAALLSVDQLLWHNILMLRYSDIIPL